MQSNSNSNGDNNNSTNINLTRPSTFSFLHILFDRKLSDWSDFLCRESGADDNNFVAVIADEFGVWRAAVHCTVYESYESGGDADADADGANPMAIIIKIPLAAVDLHFRRQSLGTLVIKYLMFVARKVVEEQQQQCRCHFVALAVEEKEARAFWRTNHFRCVEGMRMGVGMGLSIGLKKAL